MSTFSSSLQEGYYNPHRCNHALATTWHVATAGGSRRWGLYSPAMPCLIAEIVQTWPSSVASRNMVHWSQNLRTADGQFRYYDFGNACKGTANSTQGLAFL